jgi:hypothetical protein
MGLLVGDVNNLEYALFMAKNEIDKSLQTLEGYHTGMGGWAEMKMPTYEKYVDIIENVKVVKAMLDALVEEEVYKKRAEKEKRLQNALRKNYGK